MNTKEEIYDALTECMEAIDSIQSRDLEEFWENRQYKSEDFIDDVSDRYAAYQAVRELIVKARNKLEDIFE